MLRELVLESDDFEALAAVHASVDWAFSGHVEDLLVGVRIILNTWAHADDDSPGGVRGEDEYWVVNSSELSVHCRLHLVPLIQIESIVGKGGTERHG